AGRPRPSPRSGVQSARRIRSKELVPMKRLLLAVGAILVAAVAVSSAQTPAGSTYKVPRLRDGHPDLQGTWTTQTFTPLQRPKRYAGREFLTEAEADELIKLLAKGGVDPLANNIFGL